MVSIQGSTTAAAYQNDEVVAGRVNSYIALLTSDVVIQRVIDKLGLSMTAAELAAKVSATNVPPKTSVIDVAVTDESAGTGTAARRHTRQRVHQLYRCAGDADRRGRPEGSHHRGHAASEPHARRAERVVLGVLAALAALLLGAVAVWIRSLTDPVVRTANRAPLPRRRAGDRVRHLRSRWSAVDDLEGYRRLRTRLRSMTNSR